MKRRSAVLLGLGLVVAAPSARYLPSDAAGPGVAGAAWSFGWTTPALAAEDAVFDNLSFTFGSATVKIPRISVNGSSLSKADLQAMFTGAWSLATADLLARLDATSIVIPEIRVDIAGPPGPNSGPMVTAGYRDLRLDNITAGKAARVSSGGLSETIKGPEEMNIVSGPFQATDYDLAAAVRFAYGAAAPNEQLKQVSGPGSVESVHLTGPQDFDMVMGKISIGAMKARPLSTPLAEFMSTAVTNAGKKDVSPADTAKMMGLAAEFYDAFAIDGMTIADIAIRAKDPGFQGASIKLFKIGAIAQGRFAEFGVEGLEVNAAGGQMVFKLGRAALLGLDIHPALETLAALAKTGKVDDMAMARVDWRTAIPRLDGVVVTGINMTVPGGQPMHLTLDSWKLELSRYIGIAPTMIHLAVDGLSGDTALLKNDGRPLLELGYKTFNLTTLTDLLWTEDSKSIKINEISAKGADMGAFKFGATLGNASRELFAGTMPQMQVAALGLTLTDASLRLDNAGLLDRIMQQEAKHRNTTLDKIRAEWASQAALGIPQILGGSQSAKALANAVASFIAAPKSLAISVKTKDPGGLGLTDVMGGRGPDPSAIFDKLDVTATANQ